MVIKEKMISVLICTFKRPFKLKRCIESILDQNINIKYEIIICDNDLKESAKNIYNEMNILAQRKNINMVYIVEPIQNIALARNKSIKVASGDYIAMIDDDEYTNDHWLSSMYNSLTINNVDGVIGPNIPIFDDKFSEYMKYIIVNNYPKRNTGTILKQNQCRSGNTFVKASIFEKREGPFDVFYGNIGGSDTDLFNYLIKCGHKFIWNNEAVVFEEQDIERSKMKWHFKRAYRCSWGYSKQKCINNNYLIAIFIVMKSIILGTGKLIFMEIPSIKNNKIKLIKLLIGLISQIGKMGYFVGYKVEEYPNKNS